MPLFRVLRGKHYEVRAKSIVGGAQPFKPGDVFESFRPLDEMFRNKFERVNEEGTTVLRTAEEPAKVTKPIKPAPEPDVEEPTEDEEDEEVEPRYFMKHKGGGRYLVIDREDGEPAHEEKSLSKKEATEFLSELLDEEAEAQSEGD